MMSKNQTYSSSQRLQETQLRLKEIQFNSAIMKFSRMTPDHRQFKKTLELVKGGPTDKVQSASRYYSRIHQKLNLLQTADEEELKVSNRSKQSHSQRTQISQVKTVSDKRMYSFGPSTPPRYLQHS